MGEAGGSCPPERYRQRRSKARRPVGLEGTATAARQAVPATARGEDPQPCSSILDQAGVKVIEKCPLYEVL